MRCLSPDSFRGPPGFAVPCEGRARGDRVGDRTPRIRDRGLRRRLWQSVPALASPTLASVLRPLTLGERRYVLGIASLTPVQLWAAFGTSATPPTPTSPPTAGFEAASRRDEF